LTIARRRFDNVTFLNLPDPRAIARTFTKGESYTAFDSTDIIVCAGILPLWRNVGEAWMATSPLIEKYKIFVAKNIRKIFKEIIFNLQLERVQTFVDSENMASINLVERLGFKKEGLMRKYIGGRDFIRYAWVKEN